jgi:hypothetical protein
MEMGYDHRLFNRSPATMSTLMAPCINRYMPTKIFVSRLKLINVRPKAFAMDSFAWSANSC